MMQAMEENVGIAFRATRMRCAEYGKTTLAPISPVEIVLTRFQEQGQVPGRLIPATQPRALLHISYSRTGQKRGPPPPSS